MILLLFSFLLYIKKTKNTVAHAAKTLNQSDEDGKWQAAIARNVENKQHEEEDECRLSDQNGKLIDQMGQHNFCRLDAWKIQMKVDICNI